MTEEPFYPNDTEKDLTKARDVCFVTKPQSGILITGSIAGYFKWWYKSKMKLTISEDNMIIENFTKRANGRTVQMIDTKIDHSYGIHFSFLISIPEELVKYFGWKDGSKMRATIDRERLIIETTINLDSSIL